MAIDFAKLLNKAKEEAQRATGGGRGAGRVKYWKPRDGKNRIRLMPPWSTDPSNVNAGQFWREVYVHWSVGQNGRDEENGASFSCPVKTPGGPGGHCPICVQVDRLRATKDPVDAEMAKDLRAKQRLYSNVVDLDDPTYTPADIGEWRESQQDKDRECPFSVGDTKVQVWSYGPQIFKELLDVFTDQIDITDLSKGHDVILTREGKGRETKYRMRISPTPTKHNFVGPVAERLVDLDRLMPFTAPENMQAALTGAPMPAVASLPPVRASANFAPGPASDNDFSLADFKPVVPKSLQAPAPTEDPPRCFKDPNVHSATDPECVGGSKNGEVFDPCPFFGPCQSGVQALTAVRPTASRRAAAKPVTPEADDSIDALEAEMRRSLR